MSLVTFAPSGKELEVAEGTTLLAAILAVRIRPSRTNAKATPNAAPATSTCSKAARASRKIAREENEKLDSIVGVSSKSRLACQAKVLGTENVKVEILSFV